MGFEFKRFRIEDDQCAQKVCTDSILLASWADIRVGQRVLDIGMGCGILSIMLAQRCEGQLWVDGVELDVDACQQGRANVANCPWPESIRCVNADFNDFTSDGFYDVIITNPPYFNQALKGPDAARNRARHNDGLSYSQLLAGVKRHLHPMGLFYLVLPVDGAEQVQRIAPQFDLSLSKRVWVRTVARKAPKLMLMAFCHQLSDSNKNGQAIIDGQLCIHDDNGQYSSQFIALTQKFYLNR